MLSVYPKELLKICLVVHQEVLCASAWQVLSVLGLHPSGSVRRNNNFYFYIYEDGYCA